MCKHMMSESTSEVMSTFLGIPLVSTLDFLMVGISVMYLLIGAQLIGLTIPLLKKRTPGGRALLCFGLLFPFCAASGYIADVLGWGLALQTIMHTVLLVCAMWFYFSSQSRVLTSTLLKNHYTDD